LYLYLYSKSFWVLVLVLAHCVLVTSLAITVRNELDVVGYVCGCLTSQRLVYQACDLVLDLVLVPCIKARCVKDIVIKLQI